MPMTELTMTKGALSDDVKRQLAADLSRIALEVEAAPLARFGDVEHMRALSWCFVNEQETFISGETHAKPIYRVTVTIPDGAPGVFGPLAGRGREILVKKVTAAVLAAEGSENTMVEAYRVWVHLRHITDGQWAAFGEVLPLSDIASYAMNTDDLGSKVDLMRQAAMKSFGSIGAK